MWLFYNVFSHFLYFDHLGGFKSFAIINNTAVNIFVHNSPPSSLFPLDTFLEVGFLYGRHFKAFEYIAKLPLHIVATCTKIHQHYTRGSSE